MRWCAAALCCALLLAACTHAYTVDCNQDYTDCDSELRKFNVEDEELLTRRIPSANDLDAALVTTTTTLVPTRSPSTTNVPLEAKTESTETTTADAVTEAQKPKPRLLNLSVDELQTFANALHNQTNQKTHKKPLTDLSDVTIDADEDDEPKIMPEPKQKHISDKFYTNLEAPFHPILGLDRGSSESEICRENDVTYKVGEKIDRGCEETCECSPGGLFECSPRCKHPYIRHGRRLNDPLCFESPVDECCSIIACSTGNGESKPTKLDMCRYGNDTYPAGAQWHIGCEQTCTCEKNSIVTCKPRCERHLPSDKCINVQDPNDICCEVQVCDVSQDVHEEPENATTSTTLAPHKSSEHLDELKTTIRPLVLAEPIGSIKVLQNNTVQVNLIRANNSKDPIHLLLSDDNGETFKQVELKYSDLILNLEGGKDYILKTKETGTKFNFTITASDAGANEVPNEDFENVTKIGCYHDGIFYDVGEEFHIGCAELCECTGADTRECAALICPSHVGLELVSKGCVRWAPNPPAQPPNCCPRAARCLSDGTCHYKGVPVPNWSEVPIELTGCEQRCFCENGELECQETCTPLPPIPPQTLRCPPMHHPAPVNISDDDCCKQWGCLPNVGSMKKTNDKAYAIQISDNLPLSYMTPILSILPTITTSVLPTPPMTTNPSEFFGNPNSIKTIHKYPMSSTVPLNNISMKNPQEYDNLTNITVFSSYPIHNSLNGIKPTNLVTNDKLESIGPLKIPIYPDKSSFSEPYSFNPSEHKMQEMFEQFIVNPSVGKTSFNVLNKFMKPIQESIHKVPISKIEHFNNFLPIADRIPSSIKFRIEDNIASAMPVKPNKVYFEPVPQNQSIKSFVPDESKSSSPHESIIREHSVHGKHVTILNTKDINNLKAINNNKVWYDDTKTHLLTKVPTPYETVLLRPVSNNRFDVSSSRDNNVNSLRLAEKTYSALDLEHLLSQMEVESEVNRNLGRSADRTRYGKVAGQIQPSDYTTHPSHTPQPDFVPTISPEIHFPQDEISDYDQNNIHRPLNNLPGLPPGIHIPPSYGETNKKLSVISLQADSPTSVMMLFGLPPVLVGLRGSVDLRYTDKADEDVSHWYSQVFAPADEVLTTPRLEFRLTGLKPSTTYKVRGKLYLHNLPVEPESEIYTVRTQDLPTMPPVEEKRREIDSRLTVVDANDTVAHVSWRHFSEEELQFIDGIQVRYRPVGTPIYIMTELLHHSRSAAELHDLRPGSRYEASLVLIPPPKATTELQDPGVVEFTTAPFIDPYNWTVTVEARAIGSEAAELTWRGVPSPAERWVRVYRAAHACGAQSSRKEHDEFRLAARDLPPSITLTGLEPDTRCRIWLELFLTNGKVKTSNVLEINTKSVDSHEPIDNEIESASIAGSRGDARGDYYGALVIVGVVAALGALTSLLLLLVVVRRHRPRSVAITPVPTAPRESSLPPYDNPAYKLELQQETMDL